MPSKQSRQAVLNILVEHKTGIDSYDLLFLSGLSLDTAGKVMQELIAEKLIEQVGESGTMWRLVKNNEQ